MLMLIPSRPIAQKKFAGVIGWSPAAWLLSRM